MSLGLIVNINCRSGPNHIKEFRGFGRWHINAPVGTVVPVDLPTETASPVGIMESDTHGCIIRHPIVNEGIIFHHEMVALSVGDMINTRRCRMSGRHVTGYHITGEYDLSSLHIPHALVTDIDINKCFPQIIVVSVKALICIDWFSGNLLGGFEVFDDLIRFLVNTDLPGSQTGWNIPVERIVLFGNDIFYVFFDFGLSEGYLISAGAFDEILHVRFLHLDLEVAVFVADSPLEIAVHEIPGLDDFFGFTGVFGLNIISIINQ